MVVSSGGNRKDSKVLKKIFKVGWMGIWRVKVATGWGFLRIFFEYNFILVEGR